MSVPPTTDAVTALVKHNVLRASASLPTRPAVFKEVIYPLAVKQHSLRHKHDVTVLSTLQRSGQLGQDSG